MKEKITKEELSKILEDFYFQVLEISLCLDSLHALKEIENEKIRIAEHFFFITQRALVFRYSMELNKVINSDERMSIYRIRNICDQNIEHFDNAEEIKRLCKEIKDDLEKHKSLSKNLKNRRNMTCAHNVKEFYYYDKKALEDFPLDEKEIDHIVMELYKFAFELNKGINDRFNNESYPRNYDDVKKLFGMPTNDEVFEELELEKLRKMWNKGDKHDQL